MGICTRIYSILHEMWRWFNEYNVCMGAVAGGKHTYTLLKRLSIYAPGDIVYIAFP